MLLLHGLGGTKRSFFDTAAALQPTTTASTRSTCPGFGGSSQAHHRRLRRALVRRDRARRDGRARDRARAPRRQLDGRPRGDRGRPARARARRAASRCCARPWRSSSAAGTRSCALLRPEFGLLPHRFGRGTRRRASSGPVRRPRPRRPDRGRRRRRRVPAHLRARPARGWPSWPRPARSTSSSPSAAAASTRAWPSCEPPALFVWGSHDRLIPAALPPPRRALAAGGRADRARGLRPRPAGRAARADQRPAAALLRRVDAAGRVGRGSRGGLESRGRARTAAGSTTHEPRRRRPRRASADRRRGANRSTPTSARHRRGRRLTAGLAGRRRRRSRPAGSVSSRDPGRRPRRARPGLHPRDAAAAWLLARLYFRGEVRGLGNIPEDGPVLLVGNHSGGNLTPDTTVFTLAFCAYFGVERPFYQLAHNLVLSMPGPGLPAQVRHRRRVARERAEGAAAGRGAARLPGRRLRGPPARAGSATASTSAAARASSGWRSSTTCRSCPWCRSAARRPRCSSAAASAWRGCSASTGCSG